MQTRSRSCAVLPVAALASLAFAWSAPAAEPPPPRPLPAVEAPAASRAAHLFQAAEHLEAAGCADEAAALRERARREADAHQQPALRAELERKLAEFETLGREIDDLRRRTGSPAQVHLKLQILEVDHGRLAAATRQRLGLQPNPRGGERGAVTDVLQAAAEAPSDDRAAVLPAGGRAWERVSKLLEELRAEGALKVIAEPELITHDGVPASFVSGGEFPVPVPQPDGTRQTEWREFGLRVEAVARSLGEGRIMLRLDASTAERNFAHAVRIDGCEVPVLGTTRVNTQVEVRLGEPCVLGGLLTSSTRAGESPEQARVTECIMIVTPSIVPPLRAAGRAE